MKTLVMREIMLPITQQGRDTDCILSQICADDTKQDILLKVVRKILETYFPFIFWFCLLFLTTTLFLINLEVSVKKKDLMLHTSRH